jgi:hypothetical protein
MSIVDGRVVMNAITEAITTSDTSIK